MKSLIRIPLLKDTDKALEQLVTRSNNLVHGSLEENIFFLHIHKCGGTSIRQAIKSCYRVLDITKDRYLIDLDSEAAFYAAQKSVDQNNFPPDTRDDYLPLKFRENLLMYYMGQKQIKYIAGHFSFSAKAHQHFSQKYAFITMLRDPVKKWISAYFYNRYKKGEHRKIDMEITEFLKSERAQSEGYSYVKFIGGADEARDYSSDQAIARAKENLHKFSIVGCLEYQDIFVKQFEERFGRRLMIGMLNPNPKPETYQKTVINEDIKEKIRQICKPNIEIYQYAIENFVKAKD
jgi:flavin-binding protein dodecin